MAQVAQARTQNSLNRHDVVPAAVSLIRRHSSNQYEVPRLSMAARLSLVKHSWNGGMQELDVCIRQAMVLCRGEVIQAEDLHLEKANVQRAQSAMLRTVRAANGVRSIAADKLGISARTLREQLADMRAQGMPVPEALPANGELYHD